MMGYQMVSPVIRIIRANEDSEGPDHACAQSHQGLPCPFTESWDTLI